MMLPPVKVDEGALDPERAVQQRCPAVLAGAALLRRQDLSLVGGYPVLVFGADDDVGGQQWVG